MKKNRSLFPALGNTREEFLTPFSTIFDEIVASHFPEFKQDFGINFITGSFPKVDVLNCKDKVEIVAEVAGWSKEEISIEVEKGILTISGKSQTGKKDTDEKQYLISEIKRSSFKRSFKLNENLDQDKIKAKFEDGMLKMEIPKKIEDDLEIKRTIEID
jgi:HSP20 family protein